MSTPERGRRRRRRHSNPSPVSPPIRLTFVSPRIHAPEPAIPALSCPESRFRYQSQLAGNHRQDGSVFRVGPNDPTALRMGMPQSAAARVRTLFLPTIQSELLPEWMDVVSSTFPNLQHLHASDAKTAEQERRSDLEDGGDSTAAVNDENEQTGAPPPKKISEESLVRRLYVLYRLPHLQSMDGVTFTSRERLLSQPRDKRRNKDNSKEEQAKAKVSANGRKSKKTRKPVCLLDRDSDDEDVVSLKTRKAMAESAVEVALNGSILSLKNNVVRSPVQDQDQWEYSSVESNTAACEWACGSLSLPWRKHSTSKKRLELSTMSVEVTEPSIEIQELGSMLRVSTPPRIPRLCSTQHAESPVSPTSSLDSYQASKSLTSPFPMQFRNRVATSRKQVLPKASTESTQDLRETFTESTDRHPAPIICGSQSSSELQVIESKSFGNRNRSISERIRIVPVSKSIPLARTTSSPLPRPPHQRRTILKQVPPAPRRRKWRASRTLSIIDCEEADSETSEP